MISDSKNVENQPFDERPPLEDTVGDLKDEIIILTRSTKDLLKEEIKENASMVTHSLIGVAVGGCVLLVSLFLLLAGVDILIISLLSPAVFDTQTAAWVSTLSLGLICALGGWIAIRQSSKNLTSENIVPKKTLQTLEEHYEWFTMKIEGYFK